MRAVRSASVVLRYAALWLVLADYNLLAGRVWGVFLIWILVRPYVAFVFDRHAIRWVDSTKESGKSAAVRFGS